MHGETYSREYQRVFPVWSRPGVLKSDVEFGGDFLAPVEEALVDAVDCLLDVDPSFFDCGGAVKLSYYFVGDYGKLGVVDEVG